MENRNSSHRVVQGIVTDGNNRALSDLLVRAFDRDMRSESLLGESVTDAKGAYRIEYSAESFAAAEKKTADLSMKVFGPSKSAPVYETEFERIVFNASAFETIDISIATEIRPAENEFDRILHEISGLTGEIKTAQLQENDEHRDVSFLSREAGIPPEKLGHLVVAHRLQDESRIDAAFFYALLRKNTLLKNKLDRSLRMRLSIDINTEILPLLYEAALTDAERIQRDVKAAVSEMIVPGRVEPEAPKNIELLKQFRDRAQRYYQSEHLGRVFNIVSRFVIENKSAELANLLRENKNNPLEFFDKLTDESFFKADSDATGARIAVSLVDLLGSNATLISEIQNTQNLKKTEDIRKLAALNPAEWKELLGKSAEIKINDKPLDKKLLNFHAISLAHRMEREFPSVAFSAQLEREEKPVFQNHDRIASFFKEHTDFDLQKSNVDIFFNEKKLNGSENDEPIRSELKSAQRIFRLVPNYRKTTELLRKNIHSAQSISAMGEGRFVKEVAPAVGLSSDEAKTIFRKAEKTNAAALLIAGELQDTIQAADISALKIQSLSGKLQAVSKDFPNLKSLFNLADVCACEHCRSVYSPAAYMVEILEFLDNRSVTDLNTATTGNIAKDVLFERRPDLGDIDLGCENAITPVPYIDLVCELLEEAIAPDPGIPFTGDLSELPDPLTGKISNALLTTLVAAKIPVTDQALVFHTETTAGFPSDALPHYLRDTEAVCKIINTGGNNYMVKRLRQTLASAEELAAAPAYVNQLAYEVLKDNSFAFVLPFDLNHTEARAYFSRFDIERHVLMSDFQVGGVPADESIAAERLGLTDAERKLIVAADTANQKKYWNTTSANASSEMLVVDTFLTKTGLQYADLELLLVLNFIDPNDNLFIQHADISSCDTTTKKIANLDDVALDRIHRFLRLQKKTGWTLDTVDEIIGQSKLGNNNLDDNCLKKAAALVRISKETGIKLEQLLGFYGELPHEELIGQTKKPLYHQVFLNKAKNGFIDEGLLPEKVDGTQPLTNFATSLSVCLQISVQDLDKLSPILPSANVDFPTLSSLYAFSLLIRKLKLKIDDFLILRELSGIDPTASPEKTIEFLEVVTASKQFPLKPADLKFMLLHEATNLAERELATDKIQLVLEKLQTDYRKADIANRSPFDPDLKPDEQKEALQNLLSKLNRVEEDDVKTFLKFIDRDWTSPADAKVFTDTMLGALFDTTQIKNGIDALAAAAPATLEAAQNNLIKLFLDAISASQYNAEIKLSLQQTIATTFKVSPEFADAVLYNAILKQSPPGTRKLGDLLLVNTFLTTAISEAAFQEQFDAIRLLHKLFPLINSFKFDDETTVWFLTKNSLLTWFELDGIPYKTGQADASFSLYTSFSEMVRLSTQLTPVPNPADAENPVTFFKVVEMLLPGAVVTRAEWISAFALLTEYVADDVDAIDAHLFTPFDITKYRLIETWEAMERCTQHLRKLGCSVTQVNNFIQPVLTDAETSELRTALKARYDEDAWLSTLKEITDAIRPQKRNALVAYLLAVNPDMKDENDLYDYFLVDVQMESCMPSSRIVQAHGTIQLFVQRCLMGLEPRAAADLDNDPKWEQWKWMKNYRVWEANRKVFLYPENWIEAELRDDKSFLFQELEDELLQNELTDFAAEQALIKYLEKLDNIAFLEVVATWYQSDIKTMHVFARSKGGDPCIYYYRRFEQERYWTPWEKVELDITGDHLLAFVRNDRLCLAWPVFTEEPDPNPKSTIPNVNAPPPGPVDVDKPAVKLKIQLAISEFANNQWQPKKVSKDSIKTPSVNTTVGLPRDIYSLMYIEIFDQIWLFSTTFQGLNEFNFLNGAFSIAGCKGYPELIFQGNWQFPDFYPDFKDAPLRVQRYREWNALAGDELAQRNILSLSAFYTLLNKTPGNFRLSYPLQATVIDVVLFFFQFFLSSIFGRGRKQLKLPLGTLLPYFMEDSNHAYVIVPGLYRTDKDPKTEESVFVRRTGSDIMQLIEDGIALAKKYVALFLADPGQDMTKFWEKLQADPDFQKIVGELKIYVTLKYGEQFRNMYHPLVCPLRTTLYRDGIPELMKRETQMQVTKFKFDLNYQPSPVVPQPHPIEDIDFESDGSYSGYNWELFFHIPFLLATRFTKDQKFEEALTWFHYIFNPTGALPGTVPQKYWVTKPFFLRQASDYMDQRIDTLLYKIADPNTPELAELEFAIDEWRDKPFQPHVIARFRPVAYQKAVLMKYIDNLVEWGDYLFRQDTMESIAQATQMYILADKLLGPKPRIVPPPIKAPYETYDQIERRLDAFGNALIDLENILPDLSVLPEGGAELPPAPITLSTLYFCIPPNDKMLEYWDRIAERLFNIRNCRNIDGVERSLALFAPPLDPGMLVRAAAAGLDVSSILAGLNAPTPFYRFNMLSQKATELVQEVRNLGNSLLQALEKKDGEALSLVRSELEMKVLKAARDTKLLQIKEAYEQIEMLKRTQAVTEERHKYYSSIEKIISNEQLNLDKLSESHEYQIQSQVVRTIAGALALIPEFHLGASGFGGSPEVVVQLGGSAMSKSTAIGADILNILSSVSSYEANRASILGGYDRRFEDWKLQERLAEKELDQMKSQMVAAEIRRDLAELDLKNHDLQIENSKKTDEFMRSKYTNKELYTWMIGQISSVYFRAYKLAFDSAKRAERSYRFELGNDDTYIGFGYWDSLKKGLQSADLLLHDIKRMETGYLDRNKREYEVTKHISLALTDPLALIRLRATGVCDFDVPEALYDMDHPGQYFRRLKTVSVSLPCVAGPYTSVSAKLSLVSNKYRKNTAKAQGAGSPKEEYEEVIGNDDRFVYNVGAIQSIAASNSQNDSGMFELNFSDERYFPFEGCGAIAAWRLELPTEVRQFAYETIADVVLHVKYTAREGGSTLRGLAASTLKEKLEEIKQQLGETGLHVALNMRNDLPNEWHLLKSNGLVNLSLDKARLPYFSQSLATAIENVKFVVRATSNPAGYTVKLNGADVNLTRVNAWKLCEGNTNAITIDTPFELSLDAPELADLEDLMIVIKYSF